MFLYLGTNRETICSIMKHSIGILWLCSCSFIDLYLSNDFDNRNLFILALIYSEILY